MARKFEFRFMPGVLGLLACLTLCLSLVASHAADSTSWPTDAWMREQLRPKGDFREQVYGRLALLWVADANDEDTCQAAHAFAHLFYWMNDAERAAIEDDMIAKMSALLDRDTVLDGRKCISYVIGGIFMTVGPRAKAAVPSLERALKAAELARSAWVNPSECTGFEINFDRKLDYILRQALVNIDGREREKGYLLKCPKDGDPPG